jgi:kinetochore protein Spc24, fungi type
LRALEAAKVSCGRPTSVPSAGGHEKMMNELDNNRRSHLKAIDNAEGVLTAKESELGSLKEKLKELETKDVAKEMSGGLDGSV